jgi:3',5'-cyclic AMP phosphodiesterase CpdA
MRRAKPLLAFGLGVAVASAGLLLGAAKPTPPAPSVVVDAPKASEEKVALPNTKGSLKFAVIGDFGNGLKAEYELGAQVAKLYETFKYDLILTVGDNLYGAERPQDFKSKFEEPFKTILDAGVKVYAALGNHDARAQRYYKPFNMDGQLYYTLKAPHESVRFFLLDSTYPVPEQIGWLEKELKDSNDDWKIAVFHHPLYSSGGRHGSDVKLRATLEPLFIKYNVSVALTGHDHFYERIKPQNGIVHFVCGSSGQLAPGDINSGTGLTAKGFDTDRVFMAVEISGDKMYFNAIARDGRIVDSGIVERRVAK